ncbi:MAG: hypothetical protein ACQEVA_19530 [Myxococcota bacterium]
MSADIVAESDISLTRPVVQFIRQAVFDFELIERAPHRAAQTPHSDERARELLRPFHGQTR